MAVARTSPRSLYQPQLASFDMTGYDARDAGAFIKLFGMPVATAARVEQRARLAADGTASPNGATKTATPTPAVHG
jgi:hypothetical protein